MNDVCIKMELAVQACCHGELLKYMVVTWEEALPEDTMYKPRKGQHYY